jgi:hypothetical protein
MVNDRPAKRLRKDPRFGPSMQKAVYRGLISPTLETLRYRFWLWPG